MAKTTLLRAIQGAATTKPLKTQMIEYHGTGIDTPGEYSEMGRLTRHLLATSADAQLLVAQDATRDDSQVSPSYFLMFRQPNLAVVTKVDAPRADPNRARQLLRRIVVRGAIYCVSAISGKGLSELRQALDERRGHGKQLWRSPRADRDEGRRRRVGIKLLGALSESPKSAGVLYI